MAIKICLDAGHYGNYNQSPALKSYYESQMTWQLHNHLKTELEKYGFEVTRTRAKQGVDLAVYARGKAAKGCDLFLSLHSNAVGSKVNETVDYPAVIVQLDGKGDVLGRKLATAIEKTMGTKQAGCVTTREYNGDEYYGVLRGAAHVGVCGIILEHSFHTNTRAAKWLSNGNNLKKMAAAEAAVIAEHYGLASKSDAATATGAYALYRVRKTWADAKSQLGAFLSLERARELADKHSGYNVYDDTGKCVYAPDTKTVDELAREVIAGKWGVGQERKNRLTAAGYDYDAVQKRVNELMG